MLIDLLRSRRSIRRFEKKPVEKSKIDSLLEAVLRSPSSRGQNPWEFVVVTKPEILAKLSEAKVHYGSRLIGNAPLAIVVCADPGKSDVWVEDSSIATFILHLAATDLGLGSCWVQIRLREHDDNTSSEQYVKKLLGVRDELAVEAIVAIGYSAEEKPGHGHATLLYDRISHEHYGKKN